MTYSALAGIISKGVHPARHITRARVMLLLNEKTGREGKPVKAPEQTEVARQCGCHTMLVYRVNKQYVREVKSIVRGQYPDAEKVVLVVDNLNLRFENTHTVSSLYKASPAVEAFEIARKLEIHYTPKHGSWLNRAGIEISAMNSQCLDRRIDRLEKVPGELGAWQRERNQNQKAVKWQFTTDDV